MSINRVAASGQAWREAMRLMLTADLACAPPSLPCPQDLDAGKLPQWTNLQSPDIGKNYWKLGPDATMRDLLLAIRADEACHM